MKYCSFINSVRESSLLKKVVEIKYDEQVIDEGSRMDVLADDLIIIDLKAQERSHSVGRNNYLTI
jgi:hypothetical protein